MLYPVMGNVIAVVLFCVAERYTPFKKMPYMVKQIIIGIIFGGISVFGSEFGFELLGTVANIRDAAPLSAGLIFGAPAGIISGLIGGIYRWFSVFWGAGTYTRLACTIATILAGFMAAGLRKLMFDDKRATWGYGICITVICEVIHMLLIFITNMSDSSYAFEFVKGASIPMILGNSVAVGLSIVVVSVFSKEKLRKNRNGENISQTFQRWLLVCILIAFLSTSLFTFVLQNGMAKIETREIFYTAIKDVKTDIRGKSDDYMLEVVQKTVDIYTDNPEISVSRLAEESDVIEINIVAQDGMIIRSTDKSLENSFDMNSTEQSKAFMVLTQGEKSFVQQYGPIGNDGKTMRKFAGMALEGGGYIQIGYSSDQFHDILDVFVTDVTQNRHVGSGGFVAVCDENFKLVTRDEYNGKHISSIGIELNEEMLNGESATALYKAEISSSQNGSPKEYTYAFTFVEGYCVIAAMPSDEAMFMRDTSMYTSVFMQIIIFAILFLFIYFLIKKVIINNLRKINGSLARITDGNLEETVDVRSNEEFASLSDDINSTVATLRRYIDEAAARIDKELEYAKQIQLSALPANFPDDDNYSIYAQMIAAKEVGGDFYDFYRLDKTKIAFLVADVSGKGIPAAMFMMTAKTIIKDLAERNIEVNEIFTQANEKLCESNESGMFVTAWMGILDVETGKLQFANAGHNPPVIIHADGKTQFLKSRPGFVLAGMEGVKYRLNEVTLLPGDRVFLYTDGVTEATDTDENLYGENRLIEYMGAKRSEDSVTLLHSLKTDIDSFVNGAPQFDDITMLVLDYKKCEEGEKTVKKVFPAKTEALTDVLSFIEENLEKYDCPMKTTMGISVAVEEVFVNVAHYAYGDGEGDAELKFSFDEGSRNATVEIADSGFPFNPIEKPEPDITLSANEREIGGLGIFITKKTMDKVSYRYEGNKNILTMVKKI